MPKGNDVHAEEVGEELVTEEGEELEKEAELNTDETKSISESRKAVAETESGDVVDDGADESDAEDGTEEMDQKKYQIFILKP